MNPFQQQPSHLKWVAPLTGSGLSPPYLQADWLALTVKGRNKQLSVSTIMRAPTGTEEPKGKCLDQDQVRTSPVPG